MTESPWFYRSRAIVLVLLCYVLYHAIVVGAQFTVTDEHRVTALETRVDNMEWAMRALALAVIGQYATGWKKRQA